MIPVSTIAIAEEHARMSYLCRIHLLPYFPLVTTRLTSGKLVRSPTLARLSQPLRVRRRHHCAERDGRKCRRSSGSMNAPGGAVPPLMEARGRRPSDG